MKKKYKVETKGSLFEVTLQSGCYSDWDIKYYVFAGNSAEEVWEFIKIWAKDALNNEDKCGLKWRNNKFEIRRPDYWDANREFDWDEDYGDTYKVEINRLNVIYVNP